MGFKERAEVAEVVPGGVGGDEGARKVEPGVIVNGEQQGLLGGGRPPLVDGTVMLPEFADVGAAEAPVGPRLARAGGHQVGKVCLDVA